MNIIAMELGIMETLELQCAALRCNKLFSCSLSREFHALEGVIF